MFKLFRIWVISFKRKLFVFEKSKLFTSPVKFRTQPWSIFEDISATTPLPSQKEAMKNFPETTKKINRQLQTILSIDSDPSTQLISSANAFHQQKVKSKLFYFSGQIFKILNRNIIHLTLNFWLSIFLSSIFVIWYIQKKEKKKKGKLYTEKYVIYSIFLDFSLTSIYY